MNRSPGGGWPDSTIAVKSTVADATMLESAMFESAVVDSTTAAGRPAPVAAWVSEQVLVVAEPVLMAAVSAWAVDLTPAGGEVAVALALALAGARWAELTDILCDQLPPGAPVRLIASGAATAWVGSVDAPAARLCTALGVPVTAPDGPVMLVPGGTAFVTDSATAEPGRWLRFTPDDATGAGPTGTDIDDPRYPNRPWSSIVDSMVGATDEVVVTAIPAGLWIRRAGRSPTPADVDVTVAVPVSSGGPVLLLGSPTEQPPDPSAVVDAIGPGNCPFWTVQPFGPHRVTAIVVAARLANRWDTQVCTQPGVTVHLGPAGTGLTAWDGSGRHVPLRATAPAPVDEHLVVVDGGPAPAASWWRPDPDLLGVLGAWPATVDVTAVGEWIARLPGWRRRPVVLAGAEPVEGWAVQLLADQLQAPVVTAAGGRATVEWYVSWPRTAAGGTRLPRRAGKAFPVPQTAIVAAAVAAGAVAIPITAASPPPCLATDDAAMPGVNDAAAERLLAERMSVAMPPSGTYLVVLERSGDPRRPFLLGGEPGTGWQVATALWAARQRWQGRHLALDRDGVTDAQARLLANYLGVTVWNDEVGAGWRGIVPRLDTTIHQPPAAGPGPAVAADPMVVAANPTLPEALIRAPDPIRRAAARGYPDLDELFLDEVPVVTEWKDLFGDPDDAPVVTASVVAARPGLAPQALGPAAPRPTAPRPAQPTVGPDRPPVAPAVPPLAAAVPPLVAVVAAIGPVVPRSIPPGRDPEQRAPRLAAVAPQPDPTPPPAAPSTQTPPSTQTADPARDRRVLRELLGWRYDVHARGVARLLAQRPGLRAVGSEALLPELVAVSALVQRDSVPLNLTPEATDEQRVYASCLLRGLGRLPVHFGPVCSAVVQPPRAQDPADALAVGPSPVGPTLAAAYPTGRVFVEPGLLACLAVFPAARNGLHLAIWSRSGRRIEGLAEHTDQVVLFRPGTRLQVLDAQVDDAGVGWVYLRELAAGSLAEPGQSDRDQPPDQILDRLRSAVDSMSFVDSKGR